jgi:hypothetical protein
MDANISSFFKQKAKKNLREVIDYMDQPNSLKNDLFYLNLLITLICAQLGLRDYFLLIYKKNYIFSYA